MGVANQYAKLGTRGVSLVESEYFTEEGQLKNCQNAELVLDKEKGGEASLRKRGGYKSLGSALASSIAEAVEIKFIANL